MKINYRELLEQEPEVKDFMKEALYASMITNKDAQGMIASFYSFYQAGMTVEQVVDWMVSFQRMNEE